MFVVVTRSDRLRSVVEDAIQKLYWKRYEAFLSSFAQTIVAELSPSGSVECAAGIRFGNEAFFSECYLDRPWSSSCKTTSDARFAAARSSKSRIWRRQVAGARSCS